MDNPAFWQERIFRAVATGVDLHNTVYVCHPDRWQEIQNSHHGVLRRFVTPTTKVLDAGCGYGGLFDVMPPCDYTGIDFSQEFIEIARRRHPQAADRFTLGDMRDLSQFKTDEFDIAVCRSIKAMVSDYVGKRLWETIESQLCRVAKRLLILDYEEPENYFLPSSRVPGNVAVACIPRTGSTMLWRALAGLPPDSYTPPGFFGTRSPINVKKLTHYTTELPKDTKVIFLFGKVPYSVVSTKRAIYDRKHFEHCGYQEKDPPDIYSRDALGYEAIFDGWVNNQRYRTLCIRYEKLHAAQASIRQFLGVNDFWLPPHRQRETKPQQDVGDEVLKKIVATYGSLIAKVREMPDVKFLNC